MPLNDSDASTARNGAGTETRPFLSIFFSNVDKNNAISARIPFLEIIGLTWVYMGFYGL